MVNITIADHTCNLDDAMKPVIQVEQGIEVNQISKVEQGVQATLVIEHDIKDDQVIEVCSVDKGAKINQVDKIAQIYQVEKNILSYQVDPVAGVDIVDHVEKVYQDGEYHKENLNSVELLLADYLLVSGTVINCDDDCVAFESTQLRITIDVPYSQVRLAPKISTDYNYEKDSKVEAYVFDKNLKLCGWTAGIVKYIGDFTYVVMLEHRTAYAVVPKNRLRPITPPLPYRTFLVNQDLHKFEIPVPQNLQMFARNMNVHKDFLKVIGNPCMRYNTERNTLVIYLCSGSCERLAKMLSSTHFTNLTEKMLMIQTIDEDEAKYQRIITTDFVEEVVVNKDLLKYVIGKNGEIIKEAESILGITFITKLEDTNSIMIFGQNQTVLQEACMYFILEKETYLVSSDLISKVIGQNGQKVQEIADKCQLRHIIFNHNLNKEVQSVELELIGTAKSIKFAKTFLEFYIKLLKDFQGGVEGNSNAIQESENISEESTSTLESSVEGSSNQVTRLVVSGQKYDNEKSVQILHIKSDSELIQYSRNEDRIFFNENFSNGRGRGPLVARRARGRTGYQTALSHNIEDPESVNTPNENEYQTNEITGNRGRGRGTQPGGVQRQLGISSNEESRNGSLPDGNHRQQELARQTRQGAIKRVAQNLQQENNMTDRVSETSIEAAEIQSVIQVEKNWETQSWDSRSASSDALAISKQGIPKDP